MYINISLPARAFPEEERDFVRSVESNLTSLASIANRFRDTLSLRLFADQKRVRIRDTTPDDELFPREYDTCLSWMSIATRDGAMTIWDFASSLNAAKTNLQKSPTLRAMISVRDFENVVGQFHRTFPDAKDIRHAAAHPSDLLSTPGNIKRNVFTGEYNRHGLKIEKGSSQISVQGLTVDGGISTIYGKILSYELTDKTVAALDDIAGQVEAVFSPACKRAKEIVLAALRAEREAKGS